MIQASTAVVAVDTHAAEHAGHHGGNWLLYTSIAIFAVAVSLAWYLHAGSGSREARQMLATRFAGLLKPIQNKFYLDEFYAACITKPLWILSEVLRLLDAACNGLIRLFASIPAFIAEGGLRPLQSGRLQGYALGMIGGLAVIGIMVLWTATKL